MLQPIITWIVSDVQHAIAVFALLCVIIAFFGALIREGNDNE